MDAGGNVPASQFYRSRRVASDATRTQISVKIVPRLGRAVARSVNNEQIDFLPAVGGSISQVDRADLSGIPFEDAAPIRIAPNYKGQRNYTAANGGAPPSNATWPTSPG
jgi:hypothetical protein